MTYPCVEHTLDIKTMDTTVRLWIGIHDVPLELARQLELQASIRRWIAEWQHERVPLSELMRLLGDIPGINAAQVLQPDTTGVKIGVVAYFVPFEDVHG